MGTFLESCGQVSDILQTVVRVSPSFDTHTRRKLRRLAICNTLELTEVTHVRVIVKVSARPTPAQEGSNARVTLTCRCAMETSDQPCELPLIHIGALGDLVRFLCLQQDEVTRHVYETCLFTS